MAGVSLTTSIPVMFCGASSLSLIFISIQAFSAAYPLIPIRMAWAINSKDLILSFNQALGRPRLAWKGEVRVVPLTKRWCLLHLGMIAAAKTVQNVLTGLFFRRVR